jgi:hypothetical protein
MRVNLKPLFRFMEHLPKDGDEELALLKCHLLVEEVLTKLIEKRLRHPRYLHKARLSFDKKVWIARSLNDIEEPAWVWGAVERLNEARNALAHRLEVEKIQRKLDVFIKSVEAVEGPPDPEHLGGAIRRFQWAAFQVFALLAAHAHLDPLEVQRRVATLLTMGDEQASGAVPAEPPREE